jgi:putative glutamine amidotransferase
MKRIGLTQRVDIISSYGERRDALDQRWYELLLEMGMLPVPLPNVETKYVVSLVNELKLDGIVFTGGNSLCHLDRSALDRAPERDDFELALIDYAVKKEIPLFGVCRGMQIINHYFAGELVAIDGHIATQHRIVNCSEDIELPVVVNSFHSWAIARDKLGKGLIAIATDTNGNIEGFIHCSKQIAAIMWHPERLDAFDNLDINLMSRILL